MWLDIKNLKLGRTVGFKHIREVFDIGHNIKNHDDKAKYKTEHGSCRKIKKHLIVDLEKYNIQ